VKTYSASLLKSDLFGGLSVAALSIPIAVAYADIAGMPPESGLYTAVFALVAYYILGSSRHTIIGTDFATVTLFAAVVVASLSGIEGSAPQFMMLITVMTGVWMFAAGLLRLGFIANFLSKPVLLGYLNGVAIMLIVSQLDKLTGIALEQDALFRRILETVQKAGLINWPTFLLAVGSIAFLLVFRRISPKFPAAILLFALTIIGARIFDLGALGVAFMPRIEDAYPRFVIPDLGLFTGHFGDILLASALVMFVSYTSAIPVVRGFSKSKGFDPNREFYALGLAHVLIGFFGGYPVSGDDSRTAVNIAVGGKTKFVNIIAAVFILLTVFLLPGLLAAIPLVTISAIIASAGITMFERGAGLALFRIDKKEFLVFAVCILGVLVLGVYQGILFSIVLAFLQLIKRSSEPNEVELVYDQETGSLSEYTPDSIEPDGQVLIYRFGSALLFYNADYFLEKIMARAAAKKDLRLVVIDAASINIVDLTARTVLNDLMRKLNEDDVELVFARANEAVKSYVTAELEADGLNSDVFYPTIRAAMSR